MSGKRLKVALTMRVMETKEYHDPRDAISHDWIEYLDRKNADVILLPNVLAHPGAFLSNLQPDALILSNGNDLGPTHPTENATASVSDKRDAFEKSILDYSQTANLPVLGVCRGLQMINVYFGGSLLRNVDGHVATTHPIQLETSRLKDWTGPAELTTNSYHNQGLTRNELAPDLIPLALAGDILEACIHKSLPILGLQWHPERENSASELDDYIFDSMLNRYSNLVSKSCTKTSSS